MFPRPTTGSERRVADGSHQLKLRWQQDPSSVTVVNEGIKLYRIRSLRKWQWSTVSWNSYNFNHPYTMHFLFWSFLLLPWTKKRTISKIRSEKNTVLSCDMLDHERSVQGKAILHFYPELIAREQAEWHHMMEQRSSHRQSRGWFFFFFFFVQGSTLAYACLVFSPVFTSWLCAYGPTFPWTTSGRRCVTDYHAYPIANHHYHHHWLECVVFS